MRSIIPLIAGLAFFFSTLFPLVALATPYVDTGFLSKTESDTDLVIARENVNTGSFQQSIYFRGYDGVPNVGDADWDALGADIQFSAGVTIVDVIMGEGSLASSDGVWGLIGSDYSGVDRGMENADTVTWTAGTNTLHFDFQFYSGVDDIRVIVDYGDQFSYGQYFTVQLHTGEFAGTPLSQGIQIGDINGVVPGNGDFGETAFAWVPLTQPVPEPTTMLLLGTGLLGLAGARRKMKS